MLCRIHRLVEAAEMASAHCAAAKQGRELQFDARGKRERAFATNQHMCEVDIVFAWYERIEIVAADASLNLGKALGNLISLSRTNREQIFRQWPQRRRYILETAADAKIGRASCRERV